MRKMLDRTAKKFATNNRFGEKLLDSIYKLNFKEQFLADKVLIVSVGSGSRELPPNAVTVDMEHKCKPDYVCDAENMPFKDKNSTS